MHRKKVLRTFPDMIQIILYHLDESETIDRSVSSLRGGVTELEIVKLFFFFKNHYWIFIQEKIFKILIYDRHNNMFISLRHHQGLIFVIFDTINLIRT